MAPPLVKAVVISVILLTLAIIIGMVIKAPILDYYFNHVPGSTINTSMPGTLSPNGDPNLLGKTVVIDGQLIWLSQQPGENTEGTEGLIPPPTRYILIDKTGTYTEAIPVYDKLNCWPSQDGYYKIAGAWNNRTAPRLYIIWIVGGCDS